MSNTWGKILKLSIFGESHGKGIGIVIDGLPPGFEIDMAALEKNMARRAPGGPLSTKRREGDKVEILGGFFNGKTTGTPLCGIIRNTDTRSGDYAPEFPRPGTADYTGHVKYKGFNDYRGGGHFSGRLTAPLTFAGAIARQYLSREGIEVEGRILSIGNAISGPSDSVIESTGAPKNPEGLTPEMVKVIEEARKEGDSVGGIVECLATGVPAGLGSPFFNSLESSISSMIFSIPATKGIEFGAGFDMAGLKGSQANDALYMDKGKVAAKTNVNGGISGGISNGMPLMFRTVIRPTPSIYKEQDTVDLERGENARLGIRGRHDPCIVPRAVVVVESAMALCLLDALLESRCY